MFTISKQVVDWDGNLYIIKRTLKEDTFPADFAQEYKDYIGADVIFEKNGLYYFCQKIEEAQLVEEEVKLDQPTEV